MSHSLILDLAGCCLPNGKGWFAMLNCYLDDSGTHDDSRAIIWGGIAGDVNSFVPFEGSWQALLANPCDGYKPPIKAFHSTDLAAATGEFNSYDETARARTRHNFRQLILDSGLTLIAYGIDKAAWYRVFPSGISPDGFTAESFVFGSVVRDICKAAKVHGEPVSFQFDGGRHSSALVDAIKPAYEAAVLNNEFINYGFSPVSQIMGLQGADLVAHENYQYFTQYIDDQSTEVNIHLQRLLEGAYDYRSGWYGEQQIRGALDAMGA